MIYARPEFATAVNQGDIIEACPTVEITLLATSTSPKVLVVPSRVIVLTQACDLVQGKAMQAVVARMLDAEDLVGRGLLKSADVRGPIRSGRVFGWYFLPRSKSLGLPESIVDFRSLHTVSLELLRELCHSGKRIAQLQPPYREHLAKHFADTYSRIGLPIPYETE